MLLKSAGEEKERIGEAIVRISALEMQGEKVSCASSSVEAFAVFGERERRGRGEEGVAKELRGREVFSLTYIYIQLSFEILPITKKRYLVRCSLAAAEPMATNAARAHSARKCIGASLRSTHIRSRRREPGG